MRNSVKETLSRYSLPDPVRWIPVPSYEHVFQITAGSDRPSHYLKYYPANIVSAEDLRNEADLLARLRAGGLSVAAAVRNLDGDWVTPITHVGAEGWAALFEAAPGRTVPGDQLSQRQCAEFGSLAAKLHLMLDRHDTGHPRRHMNMVALLEQPLSDIWPSLSSAQHTALLKMAGSLRSRLAELSQLTEPPTYGLCHGDLYAANVAFDEHDRPTLFDFQELEYGWRACDLAQFLWRIGKSWSDPSKEYRTARWQAFVAGYHGVRPLAAVEQDAVAALVPLRLVWFMAFRLRNRPTSITHDYFQIRLQFLETWMDNWAGRMANRP